SQLTRRVKSRSSTVKAIGEKVIRAEAGQACCGASCCSSRLVRLTPARPLTCNLRGAEARSLVVRGLVIKRGIGLSPLLVLRTTTQGLRPGLTIFRRDAAGSWRTLPACQAAARRDRARESGNWGAYFHGGSDQAHAERGC